MLKFGLAKNKTGLFNVCIYTNNHFSYFCKFSLKCSFRKFLLRCIGWFSLKLWEVLNGSQLAKMKRVFLTFPCHKIYRDEAVGLKSCKYRAYWKITIFEKMWNLGQYRIWRLREYSKYQWRHLINIHDVSFWIFKIPIRSFHEHSNRMILLHQYLNHHVNRCNGYFKF